MLQQEQIEALTDKVVTNYQKLNITVLNNIGVNLKKVGTLSEKDARKLIQMAKYGQDITAMETLISKTSKQSIKQVDTMLTQIAQSEYDGASYLYKAQGIKQLPYTDNKALVQKVSVIAKATENTLKDLTKTTTLGVVIKDVSTGKYGFETLGNTYKQLLDNALYERLSGVYNYDTAMSRVLRQLGNSGIKKMYYDNEGKQAYARRLDTSIRQNMQYAMKQTAMATQDIIGEQVGADGWEVSYHPAPRVSHEGMGGEQYADSGNGVTVKGIYYPPFGDVEGLLDDYNCLHTKFAIVLGISTPTYKSKELAEYKANDKRKIEYEDKKYSVYEAKQVQRKLETKIRIQQDNYLLAKKTGTQSLMDSSKSNIDKYVSEYNKFSKNGNLQMKKERMKVYGYKL